MRILKITKFKLPTILPLFVVVAILLVSNTYFFLQNRKLLLQLREKESALSVVEENLELCYQNRAKVIRSYKLQYPASEFKLSSPLFEGKEINVKEWLYKDNVIKEMTIEIEREERTAPIVIKMWDFLDLKNTRGQVIFDDFGNAWPTASPTDDPQYKYTTAQGIVMFRSYGELSKSKSISSIHSIYAQIIGDRGIGLYAETALAEIRRSTKDLEKIADTIVF